MALTVQIRKRYGDFMLDVDFSAGNGEALALLGASGSGKSTALRCIAGICRPDRGRIELDGEVLFDSRQGIDLPPQRRKIGYLFQQYALFPHMTVEQNIAVCLDRRQRAQAGELIALLRLEGTEKLLPRQLSGGQQQRVALARILASRPRAILLDEPLSALDVCLRRQLEQELRDVLARFGGPAVWVSHDLGEVCRSCRRVCVLEDGRSSPAVGTRELIEAPGTAGAARISGCQNLVGACPGAEPGLVRVPQWGVTLRVAGIWPEGASLLGIRAERVRPAEEGEENAFPCRVQQIVDDVSSVEAVLVPEGAEEGAEALRMEAGRSEWAAVSGRERIWISLPPEDILFLRE
jgi:molybdate transport system ATP-binding protein